MYVQTVRQMQAEADLVKKGFEFSNWIAAQPDAEGNPLDETKGTMVFTKRRGRHGTEYREIEPDGSVN